MKIFHVEWVSWYCYFITEYTCVFTINLFYVKVYIYICVSKIYSLVELSSWNEFKIISYKVIYSFQNINIILFSFQVRMELQNFQAENYSWCE